MSSFKKRYHRFVTQKGFQIIQRIERFIGARSLVGDRPFFDPDRFAWTQRLEAHTDVIQGELGRVLQHRDHLPNFQDIAEDQRAILFMDVERPLPEPWASFNRAVIWLVGKTPFVQEAKKNQEAWEEKLTTALRAPRASPPS